MKKLLFVVFALLGFIACTQEAIEEQSTIRTDIHETIKVGFEDGETRIQLNEAQKSVWTKNDLLSVFYKSNANQKWEYSGETGERVAELYCVEAGTASRDMDYVVLAYPYSAEYIISSTTGNIEAKLPATQYYTKGSYGIGSNLMVSKSEFTQFSLKSVCGWLKLQLTGDGEVVKSIKFRGNNGEQVAGRIYVDTSTAEATLASEKANLDDDNVGGNLILNDAVITEVTLNCGVGVMLSAEVTSFYFSLPPQTFANGFTVVIECDGYEPMTLLTSNSLVIERNAIQPMASVEHNASPIIPNIPNTPNIPKNEIWYTNGSTTKPITRTDVFGANVLSHFYDHVNECWVILFDKEIVTFGEGAFYGCDSLTSVTIPDNVTTIGDDAFAWCSSLTSVTIPDSVTTIGDRAFRYCSSLTSVTIPDSVTEIGDGAFNGCPKLSKFNGKYASGDGHCIVVDGILKSIACAGLTEYRIPEEVTAIGNYGCDCMWFDGFERLIVPGTVETIGTYAFAESWYVKEIVLEEGVKIIGDSAFRGCSLSEIRFPSTVTYIGDYQTQFVDGECDIYIASTTPPTIRYPRFVEYGDVNIYLPAKAIQNYISHIDYEDAWYSLLPYIKGSIESGDFSNIGEIANNEIRYQTHDGSIYAPLYCDESYWGANIIAHRYNEELGCWVILFDDEVEQVCDNAYFSANLKEITLPNSITRIGKQTFINCAITSITIPENVTIIDDYAFAENGSLKDVYFTSITPPAIGECVFSDVSGNIMVEHIYVPTMSEASYKRQWLTYASYIFPYDL